MERKVIIVIVLLVILVGAAIAAYAADVVFVVRAWNYVARKNKEVDQGAQEPAITLGNKNQNTEEESDPNNTGGTSVGQGDGQSGDGGAVSGGAGAPSTTVPTTTVPTANAQSLCSGNNQINGTVSREEALQRAKARCCSGNAELNWIDGMKVWQIKCLPAAAIGDAGVPASGGATTQPVPAGASVYVTMQGDTRAKNLSSGTYPSIDACAKACDDNGDCDMFVKGSDVPNTGPMTCYLKKKGGSDGADCKAGFTTFAKKASQVQRTCPGDGIPQSTASASNAYRVKDNHNWMQKSFNVTRKVKTAISVCEAECNNDPLCVGVQKEPKGDCLVLKRPAGYTLTEADMPKPTQTTGYQAYVRGG